MAFTINQNERSWAVIAHLSGLAAYIIPLGGIICPIILILGKSESPVTQAIAKQALYLNLVVWLIGGPLTLLSILFWATIILIPVALVLNLVGLIFAVAAIALPIIGALKASDGIFYRYPLIGQRPLVGRS